MSGAGCKSIYRLNCSNAVYQRRADQDTKHYAVDRLSYNKEIDLTQILCLPFQL